MDSAPTHRRVLFVLGTGRCGTRSIVDLISHVPGCRLEHERSPVLLREASEYAEGRMAHPAMVRLLQATRGPETFHASRVAGEANQRLSLVLPALAEAVPDATYLWLIRDGRATVDSLHRRFCYHRDEARLRPGLGEWAESRPNGHRLGVFEQGEWQGMNGFARCCWYWAYTNDLIEGEADRLSLPLQQVRLEELAWRLPSLAAQLGLTAEELQTRRSNSSTDARKAGWRHWSQSQRDVFENHAGATMDRWYPGWREENYGAVARPLGFVASAWKRGTSTAMRRLIGAQLRSRGFHPARVTRSRRRSMR
jgi:hypothetical protein